jgi:hypothetical protein
MGKLYFQARQDGTYRIWQILGIIPTNQGGTNQPIEIQSYLLNWDAQNLTKAPDTITVYMSDLDKYNMVPIDEDNAEGIIIGIFDRIG